MSHGPLEDTGLENPLAVHIRNFPVSLLTQEKLVSTSLVEHYKEKSNSSAVLVFKLIQLLEYSTLNMHKFMLFVSNPIWLQA